MATKSKPEGEETESRIKRRFKVVLVWKKVYNFGIINANSKPKAKEYAEDKLYDEMIDHKESEDYLITEVIGTPKRSKNGKKRKR
jgi:hypothetical protein